MQANDVSNLSDTIIPKSDQLNADALIAGPLTIRVTGVTRGTAEQPVTINYQGDNGQPYKPCKSMRKVLIFAWGDDGRQWIGKSMTLYNNPDVKWGGVKVGGIRISHLSHIDADLVLALADTKGKKSEHRIKRLHVQEPTPAATRQQQGATVDAQTVAHHKKALQTAAAGGMETLQAAWKVTPPDVKVAIGGAGKGCPDALKKAASAVDEARAAAAAAADETDTSDDAGSDDQAVGALNAAAAKIDEPKPAQQRQPANKPVSSAKPAPQPAPAMATADDDVF